MRGASAWLSAICLLLSAVAATAQPAKIARFNGTPAMVVDGAPFIVLGAQCDIWRSTHQDAQTVAFFDGFRDMHATAVGIGIPWSKIEPEKDRYDFRFLDWFIRQAESRGLKLVVNMFSTNVCGKVEEAAPGGTFYPQYTPDYILKDPAGYQRMVLPTDGRYAAGGPPMCPNDPRTLDREVRLLTRVATHLRDTDGRHTVVMMQLDNEFYYQQWEQPPPNLDSVRCHCSFCERKWAAGRWASPEEFMFRSFADYAGALTDAVKSVYPLPLHLNSPWWKPQWVGVFLEQCPKLDLVGIDGIFYTHEPNVLTNSQVGRNIPFAAENPTEQPETRWNLDVLPYYTVLGQQGIGNLLWECHPPCTVVDDPAARKRYADALQPLRNAMAPIARARGTSDFAGWYAVREFLADQPMDSAHNFLPKSPSDSIVRRETFAIREGDHRRTAESGRFTLKVGDVEVGVSGSPAGILVRRGPREVIAVIPHGALEFKRQPVRVEQGRFEKDRWIPQGAIPISQRGDAAVLEISGPRVLRILF